MIYIKVIQRISEKVFFFFFTGYLVFYLLELAFSGFVLYALNLNYFFYASLFCGIVYISASLFSIEPETHVHLKRYLTLKDYVIALSCGVLIFLLSNHVLLSVGTGRFFVSIILGLAGSIFIAFLKSEVSISLEDPNHFFLKDHFLNVLILAGLCILFGYVFYANVVPDGKIMYLVNPTDNSRNVLEYSTGEETLIGTSISGDEFRLATENPVVVSLRIPRRFNQIDAKITYVPTFGNTAIKFGTKNINNGMSYVDMVNYDSVLESLPPYWQKVREGDLVLWEKNLMYKNAYDEMQFKIQELDMAYTEAREALDFDHQEGLSDDEYQQKIQDLDFRHTSQVNQISLSYQDQFNSFSPTYTSVSNFLDNIQQVYSKTIGYHFPLEDYFSIDSISSESSYEQTHSMRGSYTLNLYQHEKGRISASFSGLDTNKHNGEDSVRIALFKGSQKIAEQIYSDDGNVGDDGIVTDLREFSIQSDPVEPGMYKLLFETSYDLFTTHVSVSTPFASFQNSLHVTDSKVYPEVTGNSYSLPVVVYTNSTQISFNTAHDKSFQTIMINDEAIPISEVQVWQERNDLPFITKITIPKGDVKLRGDGIFTFNSSSPLLNFRQSSNNGLQQNLLDDMNYIIANYPAPQEQNGWLVAETTVKVPDIGFNNNKADFSFDFGNLSQNEKLIKIKSIEVTLTKQPLTFSSIFQKIKNVFQ